MIEAWQFSLSGNSGTRSEKKSLFCRAQKRQNPRREAVLGNNRRQPQESRLELGLRVSPGSQWANNLDRRRSSRRKAFHCASG